MSMQTPHAHNVVLVDAQHVQLIPVQLATQVISFKHLQDLLVHKHVINAHLNVLLVMLQVKCVLLVIQDIFYK